MTSPSLANTSNSVLNCTMTDTRPKATQKATDQLNTQSELDYVRIEQTIRYLIENRLEQPELADVAREIGLSEFHFQRLFSRWVGISPKKFLQHLTLADAKARLSDSASVLDATFDVGLSGPSRLHDLFVNLQHVTPGEYKSQGTGLTFYYAWHTTPFGKCLVVENTRGLTGLSFVVDGDTQAALNEQRKGWERAQWVASPRTGEQVINSLFTLGSANDPTKPISVLLRGTPYQVRVWEGLLKIPAGCTTTYAGLSDKIGYGRQAARAIGNACGANRIGVLIPCHRVIRDTGAVSGYRWGTERKKALLAFEASKSDELDSAVL